MTPEGATVAAILIEHRRTRIDFAPVRPLMYLLFLP